MGKLKIKEIIVVEGKDDVTALKRVVDGQIISVNGFSGLNRSVINKLIELSKYNDLILFMDPDHAGKKIRYTISKHIKNVKHVFISKNDASKSHSTGINVGVENASDKSLLDALKNVVSICDNLKNNSYTNDDLINNGLIGKSDSKLRRLILGDVLKIGYYNSKQLLKMLNGINIEKKEFEKAIEMTNKLVSKYEKYEKSFI